MGRSSDGHVSKTIAREVGAGSFRRGFGSNLFNSAGLRVYIKDVCVAVVSIDGPRTAETPEHGAEGAS